MLVSSLAPKETMDRLEAEIKAQGMMVFARINNDVHLYLAESNPQHAQADSCDPSGAYPSHHRAASPLARKRL
jgi:hypothetical protein